MAEKITKSQRQTTKNLLSKIFNIEKNVEAIERNIYDVSDNLDTYIELSYEILIFIKARKGIEKNLISKTIENLKNGRYGKNSFFYDTCRQEQNEEDAFIVKPFEVDEGVLECICGSRRTFSHPLQVKSGDEGTTIFAQCAECGNRWRHG